MQFFKLKSGDKVVGIISRIRNKLSKKQMVALCAALLLLFSLLTASFFYGNENTKDKKSMQSDNKRVVEHISVVKSADRTTCKMGDEINYVINVTNDGGVRLYQIEVIDSMKGEIGIIPTLDKGEWWKYTYTQKVPKDAPSAYVNVVNVSARNSTDSEYPSVFAEAKSVVWIADLSVNSNAPEHAYIGEEVSFEVKIKNEGTATICNLWICDPALGINETIGELHGGEETTMIFYEQITDGLCDPFVNEVFAGNDSFVVSDFSVIDIVQNRSMICGVKYHDVNGDGIRNDGENGEEGVEILLEGIESLHGLEVFAQTTTDENGNFCFENLAPGLYKISVKTPNKHIPSTDECAYVYLGEDENATVEFGDIHTGILKIEKKIVGVDGGIDGDLDNGDGGLDSLDGTFAIRVRSGVNTPFYDKIHLVNTSEALELTLPIGNYIVEELANSGYLVPPTINVEIFECETTYICINNTPAECEICVEKYADKEYVNMGEKINYTIVVCNKGNAPVYNVTIMDSMFGNIGFLPVLNAGECHYVNTSYKVGCNNTGIIINIVTVTADYFGKRIVCEDSAYVIVNPPAIEITKLAPECAHVGDCVQYNIIVKNIGGSNLLDVHVTDDMLGLDVSLGTLNISETKNILVDYYVDGTIDPIYNMAEVHAVDVCGNEVNGSACAILDVLRPAINVTKLCEYECASPGMEVSYTIIVENIGDTPLYNVTIVDELLGIDKDIGMLMPCEVYKECINYTIPFDTLSWLVNEVYVYGWDKCGLEVNDSDSCNITLENPSICVEKTMLNMSRTGCENNGLGCNNWTVFKGYNITYVWSNGTTWCYTVKGLGKDPELSNWVLESCIDNVSIVNCTKQKLYYTNGTPMEKPKHADCELVVTINPGGNQVPLLGVKFDEPVKKNEYIKFCVTFNRTLPKGCVHVGLKAGLCATVSNDTIPGPVCNCSCKINITYLVTVKNTGCTPMYDVWVNDSMFVEPIAYIEELSPGEWRYIEYNISISGCFEGEITNYVNVTARYGNETYLASANCSVVIENNGEEEIASKGTEPDGLDLHSVGLGLIACAFCIACGSWFAFGRKRR